MPADLARVRQRAMDVAKTIVPADTRVRILDRRMRTRSLTARWRVLPDVLVIGGMRCGTSSLYKYLGYHPSIAPSLRKEADYFSLAFDRGEDWYRSHFPLQARKSLHHLLKREQLVSFEASPNYLLHPFAPARAAALVPDARLIVMLRDPAERAFSHWSHMVRHRIEKLSFEDALAAENDRLAPELDKMAADPSYVSDRYRHFSYVARGRYAEQLERWREHYADEQFLVVSSESFYADPASTYAQILGFIGVRQWTPATFENYSYLGAGTSQRPSTGLDPDVRARLETEFAADQHRLPDVLKGMRRA